MKTLFTLLIITIAAVAQAQSPVEHRVWIDAQEHDHMLTIKGKFANDGAQDARFRYELVTIKQGKSGRSSSTQAGSFQAPAGEEVSLSNVSVNVSSEDTYVIELKIFQGDTVYLHDELEYQG